MRVKINRRLGQNKSGTILNLTDDEAQWLVGRQLATHVPDPVVTASVDETEDDEADADDDDDDQLTDASLAELKAKADELGVPNYGSKAQILERITKHEAN